MLNTTFEPKSYIDGNIKVEHIICYDFVKMLKTEYIVKFKKIVTEQLEWGWQPIQQDIITQRRIL